MTYTEAWLQFLDMAATANQWDILVFGIRIGGWIILFPIILGMSFFIFYTMRVARYQASFKWVLLAVDVPSDNIQTPLAVENIFAHLAGGHSTRDLIEKFMGGQYQRWFSFEIVSIEGYIQFLIRTEKTYRDLVEAAIYAQYPQAEITEVEDYTKGIPDTYPNDTHKCWGVEWRLAENHYYPIKTYKSFMDENDKEYFKDPMAAMLESFSRIGKGEQLWFQITVKPIGQKWKAGGFELAKKLMGKPIKHKDTWLNKLGDLPITLVREFSSALGIPLFPEAEKEEKVSFGMFALTPGERTTIEGVENKVSKIGFNVKVRAVYVAEKERFDKSRVAYGLVGAIKQFSDESSNGLKPDYKLVGTNAHYLFVEARKNRRCTKIVKAYKKRSTWAGLFEFILNTEELATLWHFPVMTVKTPLLKRLEAKRSQPPSYLPTEIPFEDAPGGIPIQTASTTRGTSSFRSDIGFVQPKLHPKEEPAPVEVETEDMSAGSPPSNLPVV
ncbi:MAG: hypothetical protein AAB579_00635 [Patescibacteria group bacterium]